MRELFRTEYNLTSDMDWYRFIPATKDEMDEYEREQGLGPCSVTHAYIDPGWRTCRWNKTIFGFVLQDFILQRRCGCERGDGERAKQRRATRTSVGRLRTWQALSHLSFTACDVK